VSCDLAFADIYVSSLQATDAAARETLVATLNKAAGWVRTELARTHTMRTTPKPRFHYDESMVDGPRLDRLIEDAVAEDRSRHPEDADEQA